MTSIVAGASTALQLLQSAPTAGVQAPSAADAVVDIANGKKAKEEAIPAISFGLSPAAKDAASQGSISVLSQDDVIEHDKKVAELNEWINKTTQLIEEGKIKYESMTQEEKDQYFIDSSARRVTELEQKLNQNPSGPRAEQITKELQLATEMLEFAHDVQKGTDPKRLEEQQIVREAIRNGKLNPVASFDRTNPGVQTGSQDLQDKIDDMKDGFQDKIDAAREKKEQEMRAREEELFKWLADKIRAERR